MQHKINILWNSLFVYLLFGVYRPTREFFTHMETSPLPVKGRKFWPMLGAHGHWAVLQRDTPSVTRVRGIRLKWSSQRTRDTHTYCRAFRNGAATSCFYDFGLSRLGFENPTLPLRRQRCNPLRHLRGFL